METNLLLPFIEKQKAQPGTLYVVATPIGNLSDLTLRAMGILQSCDILACETPSITQKLLSAFQMKGRRFFTYRDAGEEKSALNLLEKLKNGSSIALVSDAGTPTINDPGFRLLKLCHEHKIPIVPIPGPTAAMTALSVSGFPSDRFAFLGFLPIKKGAKQKALLDYGMLEATLVVYESPHRLQTLLECMCAVYESTRQLFIGRELTKLNESFYRGSLALLCPQVRAMEPKGEYVVLVASKVFSEKINEQRS